jgi:uncharacterized protein involved in exopolysaccharide biosynthesis
MERMPSWPLEGQRVDVGAHRSGVPGFPLSRSVVNAAPPSDGPRYVAAIARRKWFVILVTLLGTAAGVVASRFLDPRYSAKALLWIETPEPRGDMLGSPGGELVSPPSWADLITSYAVLEEAVRSLHLYVRPRARVDAPAFATLEARRALIPGRYRLVVDGTGKNAEIRTADGTVVDKRAVGDTLGAPIGIAWALPQAESRPGRQIEFELSAPYDAAQDLARSLKVTLDPGGSLLRMELKGADPVLATATVNAIAERVVGLAAELKRGKYEELSKILAGQYEHAQGALRSAEASLAGYRTRTAGVLQRGAPAISATMDPRGDPVFSRAFDLRVSMDQLRRERQSLEQAVQAIPNGGLRLDALAVIPSVQQSPALTAALTEYATKEAELRTLRYRYTDESAPVQKVKSDLEALQQKNIPALAQQLVGELKARETAVVPQVDSAFRFLRDVPRLALDEARLERDVKSAEEVFHAIHGRYESARLALLSTTPAPRPPAAQARWAHQ